MQGGTAQRYPQYEDADKQEAARFLACDFTNVKSDGDDLRAHPIIRGIEDLDRLNAWTEVAKDLDKGKARRHLRQRRQALTGSDVAAEEAFERASEMDSSSVGAEPEAAVADGGAVVEEESEANSDVSSPGGRELGPDQEWKEYQDEADLESEKNSMRGFVFSETYATVDDVEAALDNEFDRDVVRRHVVELLEERLEELQQ